MPGYLKRHYPAVPVHHTVTECKRAVKDEVNVAKRDAQQLDSLIDQRNLFKDREPVVHGDSKKHKSYLKVKRNTTWNY